MRYVALLIVINLVTAAACTKARSSSCVILSIESQVFTTADADRIAAAIQPMPGTEERARLLTEVIVAAMEVDGQVKQPLDSQVLLENYRRYLVTVPRPKPWKSGASARALANHFIGLRKKHNVRLGPCAHPGVD